MSVPIQELLDLLVRARGDYRKAFPYYDKHVSVACAVSALYARKVPTRIEVKGCISQIKRDTPARSPLKQGLMLPAAVLLASQHRPDDVLNGALGFMRDLREYFKLDNFLAFAAILLTTNHDSDELKRVASQSALLFESVKAKNEALIGGCFSSACVISAQATRNPDAYALRLENAYRVVGRRFYGSRGVRTLAQVLAICEGDINELCKRAIALYDSLLQDGFACGTSYELPIIGCLASLATGIGSVAKDVESAFSELSNRGRMGPMRFMGRTGRLLLACLVVAEAHCIGESAESGFEHGFPITYQIAFNTALTVLSEMSTLAVGL